MKSIYQGTMKELPEDARPYEKVLRLGAGALSDAELLAIFLRTGTKEKNCVCLAQDILNLTGDGLLGLHDQTPETLQSVPGVGPVKAVLLLALAEVARRMLQQKRKTKTVFNVPSDIAMHYMEDMRHLMEEHVLLLLLDGRNRLIKEVTLGIGSVNQAILQPRETLIHALRHGAVQMVLVHNHPSGDPSPSSEDIEITDRIRNVGEIVGIPLIDHIVIGDNQYISFREARLLEPDIIGT